MLCPKCGHELSDRATLCPYCGTNWNHRFAENPDSKDLFCRKCGAELPEGSSFCPQCGTSVEKNSYENDGDYDPNSVIPPLGWSASTYNNKGIICPQCGCENCQPHYKQQTYSTGKNYSCLQGGLGMLVAGPFGLLCGLCGQGVKTNSTSTLVWVCPNCGKEFRSRDDICQSIFSELKSGVWLLVVLGCIGDLFAMTGDLYFKIYGAGSWIMGILFFPMFFFIAWNLPKKDSGQNMLEFLSVEEVERLKSSIKTPLLILAIAVMAFVVFLII